MNQDSRIPSEVDFARAKNKMIEHMEKGAKLKDEILSRLSQQVPFHDIWVWANDKIWTVSYIFPSDEDLENLSDETRKLLEAIVEDAARSQDAIDVTLDYHSHEYVLKKFNGNYGQYFR